MLSPKPSEDDGSLPFVADSTRILACRVLRETFENPHIYHKVRGHAASILGRLCLLRAVGDDDGRVQAVREWVGCPELLKCARYLFLDAETELPKPNRFSDFDGYRQRLCCAVCLRACTCGYQDECSLPHSLPRSCTHKTIHTRRYLLRLSVIDALAVCREDARQQPGGSEATAQAWELLHLLLEYNDNSQNGVYSDGEYVAALLVALARACSSDPNEVEQTTILISRYLRREMLLPSYAHRVTCAALEAQQMLQYRRLVPLDLQVFLSHAKVGQSTQVRCAALESLAALTATQPNLLLHLLKLLAVEQIARVRHALLQALLNGPAALVRVRRLVDAPSQFNIDVVNTLWAFLNEGSSCDVRSRFLAASLYTVLFGDGHPECMRSHAEYAPRLRDLPSEGELDSLRYDPRKASLKVTINRRDGRPEKNKTVSGSAKKPKKASVGVIRPKSQEKEEIDSPVCCHVDIRGDIRVALVTHDAHTRAFMTGRIR